MAHGGHHSSSHHYHHRTYGSRSSDTGEYIFTLLALLALIICGICMSISKNNNIEGKSPLEGTYETYMPYVVDEQGYFSDYDEMVAGLKYFHEKTNVQIVVMSSKESWSDKKAVEQYYSMFNDEAHVLIVIPTGFFSSSQYYAIGDTADPVVGDYALNYLLDKTRSSSDGEKWSRNLKDLADKILTK